VTAMSHRRPPGPAPKYRRLTVAVIAATVAAVIVVRAALYGNPPTAMTPTAMTPIAGQARLQVQADVQGHVEDRAQPAPPPTASPAPTHLRIPVIGVATALVGLGLNPDNTVEVLEDPDEAGWFNLGPPPGRPGSSVILGHVDSDVGPAVFHGLRRLQAGDKVHVRLADRTTAQFAVTRVRTYPNDRFPAQRVYAGNPLTPTLTLVTCGGRYGATAGGYQANVVAYTRHLRTSGTSP
jgi:sortase (surface protein transpeptidase)